MKADSFLVLRNMQQYKLMDTEIKRLNYPASEQPNSLSAPCLWSLSLTQFWRILNSRKTLRETSKIFVEYVLGYGFEPRSDSPALGPAGLKSWPLVYQ